MKEKAKRLKDETYVLYLVFKDPRTPWYVKVFVALIVGYALSPIDLIPDFIPVLGYLDDLILVPIGITIALKMIPNEVLKDCRQKARKENISAKSKWIAALIIVTIWLFSIYLILKFILPLINVDII